MSDTAIPRIVVTISANTEWRAVCHGLPTFSKQESPYGEWFVHDMTVGTLVLPVIFLHGGWGKIAAAASTQYAIDRWQPTLLVNLGTCGGFTGSITKGTIILAERTVVYDIVEQMGSYDAAIAHYTTDLDLSWLRDELPQPVQRGLLISGDRDLDSDAIPHLQARFTAVAGDWESGAIAYVAAHNHVRCLILRGVSDLVAAAGGEAYNNPQAFIDGTNQVMHELLTALPNWLAMVL